MNKACRAVFAALMTRGRCEGPLFIGLPCLLLALVLGLLPSCGTLANGRGWGQDTTLAPGWERVKLAAWNAATAPETWAPMAAALALGVNHADQRAQEWAATKTPVFRSPENAGKMSDLLWIASSRIWLGTGLAAPSGAEPEAWLASKAKGLGLEAGVGMGLRSYVGYRKNSMDRTSPNNADRDSYLSVHGAGSAYYSTLASRHLDAYNLPGCAITATRLGLSGLAAASAWARVEAGQHYPADVLKSIALGHFMGAFVSDAFIGPFAGLQAAVLFEPATSGMMTTVAFAF